MPAKPKNNWNDVQTAIATAAIVTTLGMWNLFATAAKAEEAEEAEVATPEVKVIARPALPLTKPPAGFPLDVEKMPYVKIMFTQAAPEIASAAQQPQQEKKKKKRNKNNNNGGGGNGGGGAAVAPVTQTQSS